MDQEKAVQWILIGGCFLFLYRSYRSQIAPRIARWLLSKGKVKWAFWVKGRH